MSSDFQVCFPQSTVPISQVRYVPGIDPRTLDVVGDDFRAVDEVRVNDRTSPSVVILGPHRMLVQVPENVLDKVTSILVLSNRLQLTEKTLLRFRLGRSTQRVNGLLRLMQLFIKVLFTTPGKDIWSPQQGGGALRSLGRSFTVQAGQGVVGDFIIAVDQTVRQIIALQARNPRIPQEERLLRAKVTKIFFNRNEGALVATIELLNQTGRPALASLML